jgi:hypothetical protein
VSVGCAAHGAINCGECSGSNALMRSMGHGRETFPGQVPSREDMLIWCMTPGDARELDEFFRRMILSATSQAAPRLTVFRKRLHAAMVAAGYEPPE